MKGVPILFDAPQIKNSTALRIDLRVNKRNGIFHSACVGRAKPGNCVGRAKPTILNIWRYVPFIIVFQAYFAVFDVINSNIVSPYQRSALNSQWSHLFQSILNEQEFPLMATVSNIP